MIQLTNIFKIVSKFKANISEILISNKINDRKYQIVSKIQQLLKLQYHRSSDYEPIRCFFSEIFLSEVDDQ